MFETLTSFQSDNSVILSHVDNVAKNLRRSEFVAVFMEIGTKVTLINFRAFLDRHRPGNSMS